MSIQVTSRRWVSIFAAVLLPAAVTARISVEAAATMGWSRYVGPSGRSIGMHSFGASAPLKDVMKHFGFTADAVVAAARELLGK